LYNPKLTAEISGIYQREARRVHATLIRLLRDFDLAEEALHDAFMAALAQWPEQGIPQNPRAWLVSAWRFKAIDQLRRRARFNSSLASEIDELEAVSDSEDWLDDDIGDDQLKLIFTCCHPSVAPEAQLALTLREVCGLTTEEIARAFLTSPGTLAQRIVRAKNKIHDAAIPYEVPARSELPERLRAVLQVIYLVFNEGYSASAGDTLVRADLAQEAIRLGRLLVELLPEPEVLGLLALMLVQDARRAARVDAQGDLIVLEEQDRSLWNRAQIAEGALLIQRALSGGGAGIYSIQAAIAAVHGEAPSAAETDWAEIVGLYDLLLRMSPSPVIELNRAVAIAMRDGPSAGLLLVNALAERGELRDYHLLHAARADMHRRLGQNEAARAAYEQALRLTKQEPERRFLQKRLARLASE
jgi:RNA polymerase sigma-70 factor, ECF subfamily